jgi:hypothetical protein
LDRQLIDGTPGEAREAGYDVDHGHAETGGPRVFEVLGTPMVLDCLPRQRLVDLAVVFGVWSDPLEGRARRGVLTSQAQGRDLDILSKHQLIELLADRRSLTPRALWYSLTTAERIKVLSSVPTL